HPRATLEIYTLSLHDALPISPIQDRSFLTEFLMLRQLQKRNTIIIYYIKYTTHPALGFLIPKIFGGFQKSNSIHFLVIFSLFWPDRKSTRLNSSHVKISYAVF